MNEAHKPLPIVESLARAFASTLLEWIGPGNLTQAIRRNRTETSPLVCHSHDFCDANMAMEQAFYEVFERAPLMECDAAEGRCTAAESDADLDAWNEAWEMARSREFFVRLPFAPSRVA